MIATEQYNATTTELEIPMDISSLESGVYFININAGKMITERVVLTQK